MTCGDKFNRNCPTFGSRIDPAEVDGRPLCGYPNCGKRLRGDGTCVDGHSQHPADWQAEAERVGANLVRRARAFPNFAHADGRKVVLFHQGELEVLCRDDPYLYTYRWDGQGNVREEAEKFDSSGEAADMLDDYVAAAEQQGAVHLCPNCGQFMGDDHQCPVVISEEPPLAAAGSATERQRINAMIRTLLELDGDLRGQEEEVPPQYVLSVANGRQYLQQLVAYLEERTAATGQYTADARIQLARAYLEETAAPVAPASEEGPHEKQLRETAARAADLEEAMRELLRHYEQAVTTQYTEGGMDEAQYAHAQAAQRRAEELLGDRGWKTPPPLSERLAFRRISVTGAQLAELQAEVDTSIAFCQRVAALPQIDTLRTSAPAAYVDHLLALRQPVEAQTWRYGRRYGQEGIWEQQRAAVNAATADLFPEIQGRQGEAAALTALEGAWRRVSEDKKGFPSALLQERAAAAGLPLARYAHRNEIMTWACEGGETAVHLSRLERMHAPSLAAPGADGTERTWREHDKVRGTWQGQKFEGEINSCGFAYLDHATGQRVDYWERRSSPDVSLQPVVRLKAGRDARGQRQALPPEVPIAALELAEAAPPSNRRR